MFLKQIDLTTALRPSYLPDEVLLFVQDNVGLYEGKTKLPEYQNGHVYLTSHRICYVDKEEARRHSVALSLNDVERPVFYNRLFKSSPKIVLIAKPARRTLTSLPVRSSPSTPRQAYNDDGGSAIRAVVQDSVATNWVCTICTFSNPMPVNFDPHTSNARTPLPPCLTCGIKPTLAHLLKVAIASNRQHQSEPAQAGTSRPTSLHHGPRGEQAGLSTGPTTNPASNECPSCTFHNHPSLQTCEMCSTPLRGQPPQPTPHSSRTGSPASTQSGPKRMEEIKLSFRGGGERLFYERLKGSLTQRKWLQQSAPSLPDSNILGGEEAGNASSGTERVKTAGIAGLEQLGLNMRRNNEILIGNAFEDLETLMASAKEVVELAERFARQTAAANGGASTEANAVLAHSANELGLVTTKDLVGTGGSSETLYVSELSRNLAEFLTDDARSVLKKAGGIITLVDLWAMFNRVRGGVELVSPTDFEKAARMWETLKLPLRLRKFKKSGVLVVQGRDRTDEMTIRALLAWLLVLHDAAGATPQAKDTRLFGQGVTARDVAEKFGWSVGVADEELEMANEKGVLCKEESIEGLKFWENCLIYQNPDLSEDVEKWLKEREKTMQDRAVLSRLKKNGLI